MQASALSQGQKPRYAEIISLCPSHAVAGRDCQGGNCCRMRLSCFTCPALVCSSKAPHASLSSPTRVLQAASTAVMGLVWLNSPCGFQGGGGEGKQWFLTRSSSSSAKASQACSPVWGLRNGMPLKSSWVAKLTSTPTYRNSLSPSKPGGGTLLEVLLKWKKNNIYIYIMLRKVSLFK